MSQAGYFSVSGALGVKAVICNDLCLPFTNIQGLAHHNARKLARPASKMKDWGGGDSATLQS
eukprot:2445331-Amphidinium_carterae.1